MSALVPISPTLSRFIDTYVPIYVRYRNEYHNFPQETIPEVKEHQAVGDDFICLALCFPHSIRTLIRQVILWSRSSKGGSFADQVSHILLAWWRRIYKAKTNLRYPTVMLVVSSSQPFAMILVTVPGVTSGITLTSQLPCKHLFFCLDFFLELSFVFCSFTSNHTSEEIFEIYG